MSFSDLVIKSFQLANDAANDYTLDCKIEMKNLITEQIRSGLVHNYE